jgi:hypothetical protein
MHALMLIRVVCVAPQVACVSKFRQEPVESYQQSVADKACVVHRQSTRCVSAQRASVHGVAADFC